MTPQDPVVGPDGHVDVDVLSDLVEGLLDGSAADAAEAHVATCADCRETRDALAEVRELLGAQPAEPMPDDVFAGIQAALAEAAREDDRSLAQVPAAAVAPLPPGPDLGSLPPPRLPAAPAQPQSAPVVHLADARNRRRTTGWLLTAAAAVAAVFIGIGVSGGFSGDTASDNSADGAASAPMATPAPHEAASGGAAPAPTAATRTPSSTALPEYTRADIAERVDALIAKQTAAPRPSRGGNDAAPTRPVTVPPCVTAAVPDLGTPTAAERARFEGKTAYVLVVAEPDDDSARVAIVDAACAEPRESTSGADGAVPGSRPPGTQSATGGGEAPTAVLYDATLPLR